MHKRSCLSKPFGSECVNESQKLLKSEKRYFYHTFWSFWVSLSWKNLFSVRSEIWGLLANRLAAKYEYSHSNRDNLALPTQCNYLKNSTFFCQFFYAFLESTFNYEYFEKKKRVAELEYFWSYWLQKMCILKCIKGLVCQNPVVVNVLTSLKKSWNLKKGTFILLSHHFEPVWVGKIYFQSDLRF